MSTVVGGLRDRLITENIRNLVEDSLDALGWFDSGNELIEMSLEVITYAIDDDTEIDPNIISIISEDTSYDEVELGSNMSDFIYTYAVDIYAEDQASGKHLTGDVRAILEGRFPSINRVGVTIPIYDLREATPSLLFTVDLQNISSSKQRMYNKPFQRNWWTIMFDVLDTYTDEDD